jgi:probable rRNA maturation factor
MKLNLEINNTTQSPVTDGFLAAVAEKTLAECGFGHPMSNDHNDRRRSDVQVENKNISISLALVSPEEIKKLNKEYRQHDEITDILSFPEYKDLAEIRAVVDKELFLGELILCYDDVKEYAEKEGIKLEQELAKVVSHGVLHLLGFEHGADMFAVQDKVKKVF